MYAWEHAYSLETVLHPSGTDSPEWSSERNQMAYDVATVFHTENFLGMSGNNQASTDLTNDVRNTIYECKQ